MELIASVNSQSGKVDFLTNITNDTHHWQADEPIEIGGANMAPNPYELMLSALSSCSSITMKMYANRKEWPMEGADIECELLKGDGPMPYSIKRKISLKGPLDQEQKDRLLQIANLCPVHKMLSAGLVIATVEV